MTSAIMNKKERERKGFPEIKVTSRGAMYTSPKAIISSKKGQELIKKLTELDLKNNKLTPRNG